MLATPHPRPAPVPPRRIARGEEFKGKRVAAAIDGGRVRVRTVIKKVRVGGKRIKRKPFQVEWREPKLVIIFETDEKGRMAKGSSADHRWHAAAAPMP